MTAQQEQPRPSIQELERQIAEGVKRLRSLEAAAGPSARPPAPIDKFQPETLLWMALPPFWTRELALACEFPTSPGLPADDTLEALHQEGLAEKSALSALDPQGTCVDRYVMTSAARARVLSSFQNDEGGFEKLRAVMATIAGRVLNSSAAQLYLTPPLGRWATLAAHAERADELAEVFDKHTTSAFESRDSAELLNWIDTGRLLVPFYRSDFETPLKLALQRASRRLELFFRREIDEKHLDEARFFERDDQIGAFKKFMAGPPDQWALHFVGAGGVGKTMLMRKITTELADEVGAITARVDFDFFNADYPRLAPGVLLWSFGQELRPYDPKNTVIGTLDDADRTLRELHEQLSAGQYEDGALGPTRHPLFVSALVGYISALRNLSRQLDRKVLLIVDTCEELARSRPDGTVPENVRETFRILRALHDGPQSLEDENLPPDPSRGLPELKVIFSGRRLLAEKGRGWHLDYTEQPPPHGRKWVERGYLRLFEIRGFSHDEARHYLNSDPDMPDDPALLEAIITRSSPEAGGLKGLVFEEAGGDYADVPRCHPYEFIFYRDWAKEKPTPSAHTIRTATSTQYVELRILKRLRSAPLEALMPAVALLGRFNRETLEAVSTLDRAEFEKAFENLQRQDWIDLRSQATSDGTESRVVLTAEHGVRKRLLAYYYTQGDLKLVQAKAADYLERVTLEEDLGHLDWSSFDAALRVLDLDPRPGRAAEWWERVVERILAHRDWAWLDTLLSYLRAEDGAAGSRAANALALASEQLARDSAADSDADAPSLPAEALEPPESCMRPAVLATYAAALTNMPRANRSDLFEVWRQVLEKAKEAAGRDYEAADPHELRLLLRAQAGVVSSSRYLGTGPRPEYVATLWRTLDELNEGSPLRRGVDEQVLAALVAAVETVVEHADTETAKGAGARAGALLLTVPQYAAPPQSQFSFPPPTERMFRAVSKAAEWFGPAKLAALIELHRAEQPSRLPAAVSALHAFANSLAGRGFALLGSNNPASWMFTRSLDLPDPAGAGEMSPPERWFDWLPPADLAARVRLEYVRVACPRFRPIEHPLSLAESWLGQSGGSGPEVSVPDNVDLDRLRSALLGLRLRLKVLSPEELVAAGGLNLRAGSPPAFEADACEAHRNVPPLVLTAIEALATAWRRDEAFDWLNRLLSRSHELGPSITLHVERAHARISRRMRAYDESPREYETLEKSGRVADAALAWALDGLRGRGSQKPIPSLPEAARSGGCDPRPWLHAVWQSRYASDERRLAVVTWASIWLAEHRSRVPKAEDDFAAWSLYLDGAEHKLLQAEESRAAVFVGLREIWPDLSRWGEQHKGEYEEELRLLTRFRLLSAPSYLTQMLDRMKQLANIVGPRRAAEVVLRESELTALRVLEGDYFEKSLELAERWFTGAEDWSGAVAAGITRLLLKGRRNDRGGEEDDLKKVGEALSRLANTKPLSIASPSATPYTSLASALELSPGLAPLATQYWRPWLIRYSLLAADSIADKKQREARVKALRNELLGVAPLEVAESTPLPPDLEQWFGKTRGGISWWPILRSILILLAAGGAVAVVGFYVLRWLLSFTPLDISGANILVQIAAATGVWLVIILLVWRVIVETRNTVGEPEPEATTPVGLFEGWKSTAACAAVFLPSLFVLLIKLGDLPTPSWLVGGWLGQVAEAGRPRTLWQYVWMVLAVGGVAIPGVYLLFRAIRTMRRVFMLAVLRGAANFATQFFYLRMEVRPAAGAPPTRPSSRTEVPPVEIHHQMTAKGIFSVMQVLLNRFSRTETASVKLPPLPTPGELVELAPANHVKNYVGLRAILGRRTLQVQIDLASKLNSPAWEALVVLPAKGDARSPRDLPFRFRRTTQAARARRPQALKEPAAYVISWLDSYAAEGMAKRGWEELRDDPDFLVQVRMGDDNILNGNTLNDEALRFVQNRARMEAKGQSLGLLHLVGTPEDRGDGVRFRLARNEVSPQTSVAPYTQSRRPETGPSLLDAEGLLGRFGGFSLCVIQGDPDKFEAGERLDDARGKAMLARIFASKLFDLGVPAVLVIPPLKASVGAYALLELARVLKRRPINGTEELLEAVARIQEMIVRSYAEPSEDAWEVALDTCLYAERFWNARWSRLAAH